MEKLVHANTGAIGDPGQYGSQAVLAPAESVAAQCNILRDILEYQRTADTEEEDHEPKRFGTSLDDGGHVFHLDR